MGILKTVLKKPQKEVVPAVSVPEIQKKDNSPLKELFTWKIASRPFKARDRQYFTTIFIMIFVISIILAFIREFLLIGVIISVTFVYYVLSTVAPEEIEHKITNKGVVYAGTTYLYERLLSFFFSQKYDSLILNIDTKDRFPGRLFLMIHAKDKDTISKTLSKYLPEQEEPKPNFADKVAEKVGSKISI